MYFNENYKFWLGGFIEGEGSLTISIVKSNKARYGFFLQFEFNITQHKNGLNKLNKFKLLFNNKGQIHQNSSFNNVWVYSLKGTSNLINHIVSFYLKYIISNLCKFNKKEF